MDADQIIMFFAPHPQNVERYSEAFITPEDTVNEAVDAKPEKDREAVEGKVFPSEVCRGFGLRAGASEP